MKKKIVFISGDFAPQLGGIAQFMLDIVKELPPERIQVIALPTPGWREFDEAQPFKVKRLMLPERGYPFTSILKYLVPSFLLELLRIGDAGMVVCCHSHHTLMAAAWAFKKLRNVPYSVFLHGYDIWSAQKRRYRPYHNALLRSADVIYPNGQATAKTAQEVGVRTEKMAVINPCINLDDLTLLNNSQALRKRLGLNEKRCILTVARLVERKGVDMVIRALPQIIQKIPNAHYLIVGNGPEKPALMQLATDLRVAEHISFVGSVPHSMIASYFDISDVFVMVTRENLDKGDVESFGIVYLEANYFSKPVVAGRAGGVEDAVVHGETGLMVNPTDKNEIAEAILKLLQTPELARKLGEQGRQRALVDFTSQMAAQKFVAAFPQQLQAQLR